GTHLAGPVAEQRAVPVAADRAPDPPRPLDVLGQLAGLDRVGPELVDHERLPVSGRGDGGCPPRTPCGAGAPPSRPAGAAAGGPDGPRSGSRRGRSTPAPSTARRDTAR